MKTIFSKSALYVSLLLLIFSFAAETYAHKDVDDIPKPVGGISAIMKNVKYPDEAKKEGLQGKVFIKATIDENGDVINISVAKSAAPALDKAAADAIKRTKFTPGTKDGKTVKAEVTIPVHFKLDDCDKKKKE